MELAQDWRLYQTLTRGKKARVARIGPNATPGAESSVVTAVLSSQTATGGIPTVLAVRSSDGEFHAWVGRTIDELRDHLGESRPLCVIQEEEVRSAFQSAEKAPTLFDQRRVLRDSLQGSNQAEKGRAALPPSKDHQHFLVNTLGGWWKRVLPGRYALWLRFQEEAGTSRSPTKAAPRDHLIFIRDGQVVGCGIPDLTSLGQERLWKKEAVLRHLAEKYLCPIQGLLVDAQDWESWIDADSPWKAVNQSFSSGRADLWPQSSSLRSLMWIRMNLGL